MPDVRRPTPLAPPKMGLLAAAAVGPGDAGVRWGRGVTWLPEMHPPTSEAYGTRPLYCAPSAVIPGGVGADDRPTIEVAAAFMVYALDACSVMDGERDRTGRARRLLDATQSKSIAAEFWTGTQLQAAPDLDGFDPATATWLAKTGADNLGTPTLDAIVGICDDYIADHLANGQGMIHMTVDKLGLLAANNHIRREGRLWLSPFDNIVVADAGYDGSQAIGAGNFAVCTTPVEVWLGEVTVTDYPSLAAINVSTNDVVVWAQRDAIVLHEPHVAFGAAKFP